MGSEDVEEFLAHYGVLGMKWGKRKLSPRQARTIKEKRVGAAIGTVAGAVGSQVAISATSRMLRSNMLRRLTTISELNRVGLPLGRNLWSEVVFANVVRGTESAALLISTPKFRAVAATGGAFVGNVMGGLSAIKIKEKSILKKERLSREH